MRVDRCVNKRKEFIILSFLSPLKRNDYDMWFSVHATLTELLMPVRSSLGNGTSMKSGI